MPTLIFLMRLQGSGHGLTGARHVQAQRIGLPHSDAARSLGFRQVTANPRKKRPIRSLRRGTRRRDFARNIGAGAKTGIDQTARRQPIQNLPIFSEMRGLPARRLIPIQAQPAQIFHKCCFIFWAAARGIYILNAQ